VEWAYKPDSVEDDHLSATNVTVGLSRVTRAPVGPTLAAPIHPCSGWGLPSRHVTVTLVRSYRTVSAFLPQANLRGSLLFCGTFRRLAPPSR